MVISPEPYQNSTEIFTAEHATGDAEPYLQVRNKSWRERRISESLDKFRTEAEQARDQAVQRIIPIEMADVTRADSQEGLIKTMLAIFEQYHKEKREPYFLMLTFLKTAAEQLKPHLKPDAPPLTILETVERTLMWLNKKSNELDKQHSDKIWDFTDALHKEMTAAYARVHALRRNSEAYSGGKILDAETLIRALENDQRYEVDLKEGILHKKPGPLKRWLGSFQSQ